jgi:hypothetical protein
MSDLAEDRTETYESSVATIDITRNGESLGSLKPEQRIYTTGREPQPTGLPAVRRRLNRMAFAFALCGLVREDVGVRGADAVAKSWPGFWDDMRSIGLTVFPVHAQGTGDDGDRGR